MIKWIKELFRIVKMYSEDISTLRKMIYKLNHYTASVGQRATQAEKVIKDRTRIHLDVHEYSDSQVIIIGKYEAQDYVKIYSIPDKSLKDVVDHCKSLERYGNIDRVDCHPVLRTAFNHEFNR